MRRGFHEATAYRAGHQLRARRLRHAVRCDRCAGQRCRGASQPYQALLWISFSRGAGGSRPVRFDHRRRRHRRLLQPVRRAPPARGQRGRGPRRARPRPPSAENMAFQPDPSDPLASVERQLGDLWAGFARSPPRRPRRRNGGSGLLAQAPAPLPRTSPSCPRRIGLSALRTRGGLRRHRRWQGRQDQRHRLSRRRGRHAPAVARLQLQGQPRLLLSGRHGGARLRPHRQRIQDHGTRGPRRARSRTQHLRRRGELQGRRFRGCREVAVPLLQPRQPRTPAAQPDELGRAVRGLCPPPRADDAGAVGRPRPGAFRGQHAGIRARCDGDSRLPVAGCRRRRLPQRQGQSPHPRGAASRAVLRLPGRRRQRQCRGCGPAGAAAWRARWQARSRCRCRTSGPASIRNRSSSS